MILSFVLRAPLAVCTLLLIAACTKKESPASSTDGVLTDESSAADDMPSNDMSSQEPAAEPSLPATVPNEPSPEATTESPEGPVGSGGATAGGGTTEPNSGGTPNTGGGGTTDACASAVFCDDFEDDAASAAPGAPWTTSTNGATVLISEERAFSGTRSVKVETTEGAYKQGFFNLEGAPVFPALGSEMYGRMMMWLEATPAGSVHWTFIQGEGPSDDASYSVLYRYGGQHEGRIMANFETQGVASDCWDHSATVMPTQRWACLEWRFNVATDEMQLWLDGTELSDVHTVGQGEGCVAQDLGGLWPAPSAFERIRLGWERYQESTVQRVWVDDVVLSSEPIGCPAAR